VIQLLSKCFPNHSWGVPPNNGKFLSKGHNYILKVLQKLFPGQEIQLNYKSSEMLFSATNFSMELDLFLPSLNLAFEYHGKHHYSHVAVFGDCRTYELLDNTKQEACKKLGITLIVIPYWWDDQRASLAATINQFCPGLIHDPQLMEGVPIQMNA